MSIIGTQYNPDKAMRSQAYAFECWYNVKYEGNTIGVSKEQLEVFDDENLTEEQIQEEFKRRNEEIFNGKSIDESFLVRQN